MKRFLAVLLLTFGTLFVLVADSKSEIEALLAYVGGLEEATFVRNGKPHTGKEAEEHLRWKWGKAGDRVKTAEDFIEGCASKQYLTGRKYMIRFKDGSEKPSGEVLMEKLKTIRAGE